MSNREQSQSAPYTPYCLSVFVTSALNSGRQKKKKFPTPEGAQISGRVLDGSYGSNLKISSETHKDYVSYISQNKFCCFYHNSTAGKILNKL